MQAQQESRANQLFRNRDVITSATKLMAGKVDLKVVLLGKEYGGKTSLVERYIHGKFNSNAPYQSVSVVPSLVSHRFYDKPLGGPTRFLAGSSSNETCGDWEECREPNSLFGR